MSQYFPFFNNIDISYCVAFACQLMSSWNDKGELVASYLLNLECIYYWQYIEKHL